MYKYLAIVAFAVFPVLVFGATTDNAGSSQQMNGKKLMQYCTDFSQRAKQAENTKEKIHAYYCLGFIGGAVESQHFISFYGAVKDKAYRKDMPAADFNQLMKKYRLFCLPKNVYFRDLVPVVVNFGKKHPEVLNYPAGVLVFSALRHQYPCK